MTATGEDATGKVRLTTKLYYGSGSVAYGVADNALGYWLLFFYSQVLGVPATLAGLALFIALIFDAISDPIVGYYSDNLHSRWGRRHPLMYASAVPAAIVFFFLFNPPAGLHGEDLFLWLVTFGVLVRLVLTFYEIPATALTPELTDHYDQRTSLLAFRYFFGWWGGLTIAVIMLIFLLAPSTPGGTDGYFNLEGYSNYGILGAVMIFLSIVISSLGTHREIPRLKSPPPPQPFSVGRTLRELKETLSNRSFFAIFLASLIFGLAGGLSTTLNHYFNSFFWQLTSQQAGYITLSAFISAAIALVMAPIASRKIGKKRGVMIIGGTAFFISPLPTILFLMGLMPPPGSQALFISLFVFVCIDVALIITAQILLTSMLADVVEDSEIKTARRNEGVFFAAQTFVRKAVNGFGIMGATLLLAFVGFPEGARPGDVPAETVRNFGLTYVPVMLFLYTLAFIAIAYYRIDRGKHEENLRTLRGRPTESDPDTQPAE